MDHKRFSERPATGTARPVDARVVVISALAVAIALGASVAAVCLTRLIALITNLAFFQRFSLAGASPSDAHLGAWVLVVPVLGGLVVGAMARFGSKAIRGHGIPEAMERVLFGQSRIDPRLIVLKPVSSAIAIGTGGPFGAEGPIIATGGALGSLVGQLVKVTADERKTLLAAGAIAGMAATFGTPVAAVLLAVELLLFEYRPRSMLPVAMAAVTATAVRAALVGAGPVFAIEPLVQPGLGALAAYVVLGGVMGVLAVAASRAVYAIEDAFERLPIHWAFWPALGGLAVGAVGYVSPHTLGVGYENIDHVLDGSLAGRAALIFCAWKFVSWSIALGSGTSGGTLAPLFTIGGGLGSVLGGVMIAAAPSLGVDVRMAALVGMAAMFAGASRALLASVVFAFETTRDPAGVLPLLGGCVAAYLVSALLMKSSIMTERLVRRGARVLVDYGVDYVDRILVRDTCSREVVTLAADRTIADARAWIAADDADARHAAYPVVDTRGGITGVVTRRELLNATTGASVGELVARPPVVIGEDASVREAADRMLLAGVGRILVVSPDDPSRLVGILSRSDVLAIHAARLDEAHRREISLPLRSLRKRSAAVSART